MNESMPVLWSDDISSEPASPIAILRAQQRPLRQRTKGLLEAEIETTTGDTGQVRHGFDLVAPALNRARYRILYVTHKDDLVYPVIVEAECFKREENPQQPMSRRLTPSILGTISPLPDGQRRAATDEEFINLVGEVLRSPQVRSLIQSLIARSNDQRNAAKPSTLPDGEEDAV